MATPSVSEISQYFDFGEAAMPDAQQETSQDPPSTLSGEGYLNHEELQSITNPGPDFNTDFSTHLPRYQKPSHPCDYCRSKGLECFIYDSEGSCRVRCSPCNALFRPCSFTDTESRPTLRQKTALDTLDVVGEDDERCFGGLTGKKQLRSLGHLGPIEDENQGEDRPKKGAAAARFPRAAVKILKDWMLEHIDHPYPTDEDKELLKEQTGLSLGQISNWMANTRRRQKARPKRSASPSIRPSTEAINIPAGRTWESLNPFERWKHSPPENEPAPMNAIAQAVETFDLPASASTSTSYRNDTSNDSNGSFSIFRAPSISSLETTATAMSSGSLGSHNSAYSYGSRLSLGSMNSLKSKERRRRRRLPTRAPRLDANESPRLFQCTFCTDRFKSKYDWSRHEKSLHLSLEKWICAPLGKVIVDKATGKRKCVYCDDLEPSEEHLASHHHSACEEKGLESRTFYRKDHLRQHLRLMHECKMTPSMETWKSEAQYIKSRCGFCQMSFDKWQDRVDHLAKEFRGGADMKNWKGCRGLDAHVAIHVTNAMPPYLIANESKSPFPFSASNSSSLQQSNLQLTSKDLEYLLPNYVETGPSRDLCVAYQDNAEVNRIGPIVLTTSKMFADNNSTGENPNATCWEILTLRLGRFAREHIAKHGANSITDDMLQREARLILYNDADGWDQTAADNPEWLTLFKKAHGIDASATACVQDVIAQHDLYEDLGLHTNSVLDPSFNLSNFRCLDIVEDHPNRFLAMQCSLSGSVRVIGDAMREADIRRSTQSTPGLSGSNSPTSLLSHAPLVEISPDASLNMSNTAIGESANLGLVSFDTAFSMPPISEKMCNEQGEEIVQDTIDFQFPSWDQLPEEFQNPTSSADLSSTIPISTTSFSVPNVESSTDEFMAWDNEEMNFTMDMDLDLDMDLNAF
ncbi:hypothetical protein HBI32_054660 [Parastagonospora nodorum]|nr:hypothetical protein HBI32_054660 [Parastagonospora nodorum]